MLLSDVICTIHIYGLDFLFKDVEFIEEKDEGGVREALIVLYSSEHLNRLHQFVFLLLKLSTLEDCSALALLTLLCSVRM